MTRRAGRHEVLFFGYCGINGHQTYVGGPLGNVDLAETPCFSDPNGRYAEVLPAVAE
jgi:hypothetical protein